MLLLAAGQRGCLACGSEADEEVEGAVAADADGHQFAGLDMPGDVIIFQ